MRLIDHGPGGRLSLLETAGLNDEQAAIRDRLIAARGSRGYAVTTATGELIGPFNALLRVPGIGAAHLAWVRAIAAAGIAPDVTEAVILTVAAAWGAPYIRYAHTAAARAHGIAEDDIAALLVGTPATGLSPTAQTAQRLTRSLVLNHRVDDELYASARAALGEEALVALVVLIGQYLTTAAILTCFNVPAPL
jgi:4-carboxymuconolactone decarboxylase